MANKIIVQDVNVPIKEIDKMYYISLTDIARSKNTIEFIGLWEKINNPNFKGVEFDTFKNQAGVNSFILTPKQWINTTNTKFIKYKIKPKERLARLNKIAIEQLQLLLKYSQDKIIQ